MKWNHATVLDNSKNKNDVFPQIKVGHRVYTEAGTRTDDEGRRYNGSGPSLDELVGSHTLRIQKFGAMTDRAEEPGDGIEKAVRVRPVPGAAGGYTAASSISAMEKQD